MELLQDDRSQHQLIMTRMTAGAYLAFPEGAARHATSEPLTGGAMRPVSSGHCDARTLARPRSPSPQVHYVASCLTT